MIGLVLCVYSIFMEIVKGMYSSDEVKEIEVKKDSLDNKRRRRKRRKRRYKGRFSFLSHCNLILSFIQYLCTIVLS